MRRALAHFVAAAVLISCASTGETLKPGKKTEAIKNLVTELNGKVAHHEFSSRAVSAGRNLFFRRTYTTISVLSGSQPLAAMPDILISNTTKEGIRFRFYAQRDSNALRQQSIRFAEIFINAMAPARNRLWSASPPFIFTYNSYLVGDNDRVDGQITRVFQKNNLELSFYARAASVEKNKGHLAIVLAHETYHLMKQLYHVTTSASQGGYTKTQRLMIEEAAAAVFGHCVGINVSGQVSLDGNLINTLVNEESDADRRTGSLDDQLLQQILQPGYKISKDYARVVYGPIIFTTLWAEYAGQARTIKAGSPAAQKFMDLCQHHIWPPQKLIPVLQRMASDGVDPPQLLPAQPPPSSSGS